MEAKTTCFWTVRWEKRKVSVTVSPQSMTATDIVENFSVWKALKSKYLYTKRYYGGTSSLFFHMESVSKYLFYLSFAASVALSAVVKNYLFLGTNIFLFLLRYLIQLNVLNKSGRFFGTPKFHLDLGFFDIFQPLNNVRFKKYAKKRIKIRR